MSHDNEDVEGGFEEDELEEIDVEEDLKELAESIQRLLSQEAPWTPLPTWLARVFQQEHPDAAIDVEFPTVYEENRSEVIRDISTAEAQNYITHRRAAERVVKELGIEQYDYDEEQRHIKAEKAAGIGPAALGGGDGLAKALGMGGGGGNGATPPVQATPAPSAAPSPRHRAPAPAPPKPPAVPSRPTPPPAPGREPKRADLSHEEVRGFRRDMRTVETLTRHLKVALGRAGRVQEAWRAMSDADRATLGASNDSTRRLVESITKLADRLGRIKPPVVRVAPAQVTVRPHIEVQAPSPHSTRYERDKHGAIIRSVPEPPQ